MIVMWSDYIASVKVCLMTGVFRSISAQSGCCVLGVL